MFCVPAYLKPNADILMLLLIYMPYFYRELGTWWSDLNIHYSHWGVQKEAMWTLPFLIRSDFERGHTNISGSGTHFPKFYSATQDNSLL